MSYRPIKLIVPLLIALGVVVFYSLSQIQDANQLQRTADARATAVQRVTDDSSKRMREALSANIAARALSLSETNSDVAILIAIEALNVLKSSDTLPHAAEHAIWQTLANGSVLALTGTGQTAPPPAGQLLSPNEQWQAAYNEYDSTVKLWDLTTGPPRSGDNFWLLTQHSQPITAVAFSPDNRWFVTGSKDDTAVLYDLSLADPTKHSIRLTGHTDDINDLAFSPDGKWLATGSNDFTLRLYPMRHSQFQEKFIVLKKSPETDYTPPFDGHSDCITAVAFSPNSNWLASASLDGTVRMWSLPDDPRYNPVVLDAPKTFVNHLAFSPEGRWLTAIDVNNQSYVWSLSPAELKTYACIAVGRNLSQTEWALHLPELRYNETCTTE